MGSKKILNLDALRLDPSLVGQPKKPARRYRTKTSERWLAGPIPMWWKAKARKLGGTVHWVGDILWHLRGLNRKMTVLLSNAECERWEVSRQAKWRALSTLEEAGLISVERRGNKSPIVTLVIDHHD